MKIILLASVFLLGTLPAGKCYDLEPAKAKALENITEGIGPILKWLVSQKDPWQAVEALLVDQMLDVGLPKLLEFIKTTEFYKNNKKIQELVNDIEHPERVVTYLIELAKKEFGDFKNFIAKMRESDTFKKILANEYVQEFIYDLMHPKVILNMIVSSVSKEVGDVKEYLMNNNMVKELIHGIQHPTITMESVVNFAMEEAGTLMEKTVPIIG